MYDWKKVLGRDADSLELDGAYDIAFTSSENLDDRSDWSFNFLRKIAKNVVEVEYLQSSISLKLDGEIIPYRKLNSLNFTNKRVLIDSTSLAFPEILYLFSIFERDGQSFDVLYVQPESYKKNTEDKHLDDIETFSLSDDGVGPRQLQPFVNYSDDISLTVCLGFEGHRFGALVHSEEFNIKSLNYIIGVPAFKLGWENKTLANNYKMMMEVGSGLESNYKIAPANDPICIYESIDSAYKSATYLKRTFFLAPFGTKPAAVAAANFAVNKKQLVVIYDFVRKKKQRSSGTDLVHLWRYAPTAIS
jgi:hypothetical protein